MIIITPVNCDSLYQNLNAVENELIARKIYEDAVTVIKNDNQLLPLTHLDTLKIASLSIGSAEINAFQSMLGNYANIDQFNILSTFSETQSTCMVNKVADHNLVIVSIHNTNIFASKNFGLTKETFQLIDKISEQKKVILAFFGNPYGLNNILHPAKLSSVVVGYQDMKISNEITAQVIMGSIEPGDDYQ